MKNKKIFIIISICLFLSSNTAHCAQEQTWLGKWWQSWFPKTKEQKAVKQAEGERMLSAASKTGIAAGAIYGVSQYPRLGERAAYAVGGALGVSMPPYVPMVFGTMYFAFFTSLITSELLHYIQGGDRAIVAQKIKDYLRAVIANPLLYPTRSSKIHVLLKKDEFLEYIKDKDKDGLLDEVCSELIKEIDIPDYPQEQQAEDEKINKYISILNTGIAHLPLEQQIAQLGSIVGQQKTIEEMRGYLSLYYRLKNKLVVEEKLRTEGRTSRVVLPQQDFSLTYNSLL